VKLTPVIASEAKQSSLVFAKSAPSAIAGLDCFASLAMTGTTMQQEQ
jgi:hypothetical protein